MAGTEADMSNPGYYPLFLNVRGRKCLVVGGGEIALRKVRTLLDQKARVVVVSPDICPQLAQLAAAGEIEALQREYEPGDLQGALLAIAATDDATVNVGVARDASTRRVLVNVVDDAQHSDFIVPSSMRRGGVAVAVSTAGNSPALARKIRTYLEQVVGPEYASLVRVVAEVRSGLRSQGITVAADTWQEALELDSLLELVRAGRHEQAKSLLLDNLGLGADQHSGRESGSRS